MKLLVHPQPYEYESLSNYLKRLAEVNTCPERWIKTGMGFSFAKGAGMVNCYNKKRTYIYLQEWIDITQQQSYELVIDQFNSKKLWYHPKKYNSRHVIGRDISDYVEGKYTKFCPLCFKQKEYHRIYWQLRHIDICLEHDIIMIDKCENCGERIEVNSVINGSCTCGFELKNSSYTTIYNGITENQIHLYYCYGIKTNRESQEKNFNNYWAYQLKLSNHKFLYFYSFLYKSIYDNLHYYKEFENKFNQQDTYTNNGYTKSFIVTNCVDSIITKWPGGFLFFLKDMYNAMEERYKNDYKRYSDYILKPSLLIKDFITEISNDKEFSSITELINIYYESSDTIEKYRYRLRHVILSENYLLEYVPSYILGIRCIEKLIKTYTYEELSEIINYNSYYPSVCNLIKLEDMLLFINKVMKITKKKTDTLNNTYISLEKLKENFLNFNIDYSDIFPIIFSGDLNVFADDYNICKTSHLYVCKDEAYILLLELALKKMKALNSGTFIT